ncbi:MAG TPA: GDSL-type esterase/lipase family protein [Pseudolabrys sp.]|nr:GDSL-type esterase/lipase family protein [Pseudolabrys sp.]
MRAQDTPTAPAPALSKSCQPGVSALTGETPLPNVAAALAQRKSLRILSMGAAPGRVTVRGGDYTDLIETILHKAIKDVNVVMINRGVSGELAANAATRMKNEVALDEPDLVLWQVGTNDALAYVGAEEFAATLKEQIAWLKAHKVDVVLVGLQFAPQMLRDAHYNKIRDTLRDVAAQENVLVVRFFEAMQIIEQAQREGTVPAADEFDRTEAGYNCLAQYVARAITLGVFAKNMPKRPEPPPPSK